MPTMVQTAFLSKCFIDQLPVRGSWPMPRNLGDPYMGAVSCDVKEAMNASCLSMAAFISGMKL